MMYEKFVRDFADRTRKNLDAIDALLTIKADVFEITQLVNSCLGLTAFPRDKCFCNIPKTALEELVSDGWPTPKDEGDFSPARNLRDLIRHLRNGITHGHVKFFSDEN